ncbi:MAG TPA: DUF6600 domain-containing protein [Candidatus Polarisedimenticolia bacterium]|nr:DUF6600 domain-containing protein [Candidatus Polarisedimenticolia bacterium]
MQVVRADSNASTPVTNQPIAVGDRVRTGEGRAEIELADATLLWIDRDTILEIGALTDPLDRVEPGDVFTLVQGSIQIEAGEPAGLEVIARVDSAPASVYLLSSGLFRIEARRGLTTLASHGGLAEFSGEAGSVLVRSGQRSVAPEGGSPTEPRRQTGDRRDPFDAYVMARAETTASPEGGLGVDRSDVPETIEPYLAELARYGAWQKMPSVGAVWRPHQAAAWMPYQRGRWMASSSGWFWVSDEPWGWAPYRFGRWEQRIGLGWIWIPGLAWGNAWVGFAVTPTHVGWCPLNFWNQPALAGAGAPGAGGGAARLDPRAWVFVPVDRFARPVTPQGVVRADRLPRGPDPVFARRLPEFEPARVPTTVEGPARFVDQVRRSGEGFPKAGADLKPVSFKSEEQAARTASGKPGGARRRGALPVVRAAAPPPAHPPRTTSAGPEEARQGHAVERLVEGTHLDPPPPPPPPRPAAPGPGAGASSRKPRNAGTPASGTGPRHPIPPPDDAPTDVPHR